MDIKKNTEQTLVLIKPDALKISLTGYILSQLSEFHTGLRFAGAKIVNVSRMLAEEHYAEHKGKAFFPALLEYITGKVHYPVEPGRQRVIALVYHGEDAIKKIRAIAGPTNPHNARDEKPGCIRSLGTVVPIKNEHNAVIGDRLDNLIHASANPEDAEREIKLWFAPQDIPPSMHLYPTETSDEYFFFQNGKLAKSYEKESSRIVTPGDLAWKSDMDALRLLCKGESSQVPMETVAAKYLINKKPE